MIELTRVRQREMLRSRLGAGLLTAVVLYTGHLAYTHEDGTKVFPLDHLWTPF